MGASPQIGEILPLCHFLTVLAFFLDPAPKSNRWTDLHALWLKRRVSAQGWSFWELERWGHPPKSPKMGGNRQFQAKTPKNRHTSETINPIKTKFDDQAETTNSTLWVV